MIEHEIHHRGQLYQVLGDMGIETHPLFGANLRSKQQAYCPSISDNLLRKALLPPSRRSGRCERLGRALVLPDLHKLVASRVSYSRRVAYPTRAEASVELSVETIEARMT